jgi:hypothetical protein
MSDPKVDALARVPLFSRCTRKELEFLASRTDEVQLKANDTLIKQGSASDCFYVLLEGEATVEVDGKPRPSLQPAISSVRSGWTAAVHGYRFHDDPGTGHGHEPRPVP